MEDQQQTIHFASVPSGRFKRERDSLFAISLNEDDSAITSIPNNFINLSFKGKGGDKLNEISSN